VIYVTSQLASTYFMSATVDRTQRMIFFALPFLFIPFVINFKAGLVLYWATTNLWTVGQGIVTRRLVPRTKVAPPKKSSRTPPRADSSGGDGEAPPAVEPDSDVAVVPAAPRRVKRKKKRGSRR
jgi:YidC/Oxa1 family membrane protein insertase